MQIRAPKDFWAGVMFIAFAAVDLLAARNYSLGSAGKMGPGYFPTLLGIALALVGAILVARSLVIPGDAIRRVRIVPLAVIAGGVTLFGLTIESLGLVIAIAAVTIVVAFASRRSRPLETAALVVVLATFSVAVFIVGLRLPLPLWPVLF